VSVVCCQVDVSATSWSLVQRSPTECDASLCVFKKSQEWGGHGQRWAAGQRGEKKETNGNLKSMYLNIYKYLRVSFDSPSYIAGEVILLVWQGSQCTYDVTLWPDRIASWSYKLGMSPTT
jgi:hypothetical protein